MTKDKTWVVVADAGGAEVFEFDWRSKSLEPAWRHRPDDPVAPSREIASDRPGRTFDRAGQGRHAKEPPTDPARHAKMRFARDIAERLDAERKNRAFDHLILVAPPRFLGDLRANMSAELQRLVAAELDKDLSGLRPEELSRHLSDAIKT